MLAAGQRTYSTQMNKNNGHYVGLAAGHCMRCSRTKFLFKLYIFLHELLKNDSLNGPSYKYAVHIEDMYSPFSVASNVLITCQRT